MYDIAFQKYLAQKTDIPFEKIRTYFEEAKEDVFVAAEMIIKKHSFDRNKLGKIWGDYISFAYVNPKDVLTDNEFIKKVGFDFVKQKK